LSICRVPDIMSPHWNGDVIVRNPDEYRARAAETLIEAQAAPEEMRLNLIIIAQQWLDLAEKAARKLSENSEKKSDE
jgi:hypothetical protein